MADIQTGPQLTGLGTVSVLGIDVLLPVMPATYKTYRAIAEFPTIKLALKLSHSAIMSAKWTLEYDDDVDDDMIEFIDKEIQRLRYNYIRTALNGTSLFGWQAFEIVHDFDDEGNSIIELKPLLQDITKCFLDRKTGKLLGVRQYDYFSLLQLFPTINIEKLLFVNLDQEGDYYYGKSLIEGIRETYNEYYRASLGAQKYDEKISGGLIRIFYPDPGTGMWLGIETENATIAQNLAAQIVSGGGVICLPNILSSTIKDLNVPIANAEQFGWKIDYISDSTPRQPAFAARLKFLEAVLVRGIIVPERSLLEGQFGTKAEAGVHQDFAVTYMEQRHLDLTIQFQKVVDLLVELNFGAENKGKIKICPSPMVDAKAMFLQTLYSSLAMADAKNIDTDALKDLLGVPKAEEITPIGEEVPGEEDNGPESNVDPSGDNEKDNDNE